MVSRTAAHLHAVGAPGGAAVQPQLRRTVDAEHLDVLPEHAARVAGAERLHRRFLRREAAREMRDRVAPPRTIGDLPLREDPPEEAVAIALSAPRRFAEDRSRRIPVR